MPKEKISVREAANRRGCSLKWIYDLLYMGKLRGQKLGNLWRIDAESLESLCKRRVRK
jgi:excisionase family DNA binding protein